MNQTSTAPCMQQHPQEELLRSDRIPHIWCSGCGIGTVFSCVLAAIRKTEYPLDDVAMVSGIGCTGRMAGYIKVDSYHTTHGRAIAFATGLKLARPEGKVLVASGDGDLIEIGCNHFIHAARRNIDMTIICVNNLNYGMTGGQQAPSTPFGAKTTTSPSGIPEEFIRDLSGRVKALIMPEINMGQMVLELERCAGGRCPVRLVAHAGGSIIRPASILKAVEDVVKEAV